MDSKGYGLKQTCEIIDAEARQVIHWCEKGLLDTQEQSPGKGNRRRFDRGDLFRLQLVCFLTEYGKTPVQCKALLNSIHSLIRASALHSVSPPMHELMYGEVQGQLATDLPLAKLKAEPQPPPPPYEKPGDSANVDPVTWLDDWGGPWTYRPFAGIFDLEDETLCKVVIEGHSRVYMASQRLTTRENLGPNYLVAYQDLTTQKLFFSRDFPFPVVYLHLDLVQITNQLDTRLFSRSK